MVNKQEDFILKPITKGCLVVVETTSTEPQSVILTVEHHIRPTRTSTSIYDQ